MLNLDVKKLLLREIPSTLAIDGHSFTILRTFGSTPLNSLTLPTVNLKVIGEGTPFYRSFDDGHVFNNSLNIYQNTYTCTLRYTVAATDKVISASQSIKYLNGVNSYVLAGVPVKDIVSIPTFVKDVDYRLNNDRDEIEWIGNKPSANANFTVTYNWINSGLYISHQLLDYLMKDVRGRVFDLLSTYKINVVKSKGVVDISDIYANDALSAFSFDIVITYPFTWTTSILSEDAVTATQIDLDLYVNEINVGTISKQI
jgi:hypothetical protein